MTSKITIDIIITFATLARSPELVVTECMERTTHTH